MVTRWAVGVGRFPAKLVLDELATVDRGGKDATGFLDGTLSSASDIRQRLVFDVLNDSGSDQCITSTSTSSTTSSSRFSGACPGGTLLNFDVPIPDLDVKI